MDARIEMLVNYYGLKAQIPVRITEQRVALINDAIERAQGDIAHIKAHIDTFVNDHVLECAADDYGARKNTFIKCFKTYYGKVDKADKVEKPDTDKPQPDIVPIPTPAVTVTDTQVQYSMSVLEQAVIQLISKTQTERIEAEIMGGVEATIRDFIQREYGTIERKIITVVDGKKADIGGVQHEKFETVLKLVSNKIPVMLTGAAGTGKNVICKQVARALGLKFYFSNAVTQEYKLTGFTDANGRYQPTQFYKAFTEGGVFMLDEIDASIPEVLVILNSAIANGYFDFPAPIGYVDAHPDFRVVAAGNTTGNGADLEYVGRNQLDASSLDRFAMVKIDYSEIIENAVSGNDLELVDFCRSFRKEAACAGCMIIVSYRCISRLATMIQIMSIEEALETCLLKGLDADSVRMIAKELPPSRYKTALEHIAMQSA